MPTRSYRAVIPYGEPTFKEPGKVYEGAFEIEARTPSQAKALAIEEFRRMADASLVRWRREIVVEGIRVEPVGGANA